jgi:hypothetical protein
MALAECQTKVYESLPTEISKYKGDWSSLKIVFKYIIMTDKDSS